MNDAALFIWLRSIENRLQKHGAAKVRLSVEDTATPEWRVSTRIALPSGWPVEFEITAPSILELMDIGNKRVDNFDIDAEIEKERAKMEGYSNLARRVTSTSSYGLATSGGATTVFISSGGTGGASSGSGLFGGGGGSTTNYQSAQQQALANQGYQSTLANSQAVLSQALQSAAFNSYPGLSQQQLGANTGPVVVSMGPSQFDTAVQDAYSKMMAENVTKPTLGRKAMRVLKNLRGK